MSSDPFGIMAAFEGQSMEEMLNAYTICAAPQPVSNGNCSSCLSVMCRDTNGIDYKCTQCGLIAEGDSAAIDDDASKVSSTARLRIVGSNSGKLQPDLYRSGAGNTAETQKKLIYSEYCEYRARFIENGGRALPFDACKLASEYYNEIQVQCVKRSKEKRHIMAACFKEACIHLGFSPSKTEIAAFMQLPSKGMARGANFIRGLVADGKMDIDMDADPSMPEITTLFAHLGLEDEKYDALRKCVYDVVQIAIANNIGTKSVLRSKVAGATYVVLKRCKDKNLISKPIPMAEFCSDYIRKNTVERFTNQLESYNSYFEHLL